MIKQTGSVLLAGVVMTASFAVSAQEYEIPAIAPYHIREAVSSERPDDDTARDAGRMPAHVLTLADLNVGDSVIELSALGQYYSRIIAEAIGPEGRLAMYDLPSFAQFGAEDSAQAFMDSRGNAEHALVSYDEADYPRGADAAYSILAYHDLPERGADPEATNERLYDALRPGGLYLVIDHRAADGTGWSQAASLHRIDKQTIIDEVTGAGFELVTDSDLLAHPEDPRTAPVFSMGGMTDRVVLLFRKPRM